MAPPYKQMIFINLSVSDLAKSIELYTAMGFVQNKSFTDANATMMSLPDDLDPKTLRAVAESEAHMAPIKVMLLTKSFFQSFLPGGRQIADASTTIEVLNAISMQTREMVDAFVEQAGAAGAKIDVREKQDLGFMYGRAFADLDGHIWEVTWMDPASYEGKK